MLFEDFFREATGAITIAGTNPLAPHLENSARFFVDLLTLNARLTLTILCESDSENFSQALCVDTTTSEDRRSYTNLSVHRDRIVGHTTSDGLLAEMAGLLEDAPHKADILERVRIYQVNLRLPANIIQVDDRLWLSITTLSVPGLSDYVEVGPESLWYRNLQRFLDFYTDFSRGGIYLSAPREDLIQLYDLRGYPRGIFPRACFYTTAYARYSIWGFVFNRQGELLLHQRSKQTKDGRYLWDKSIGGHVDLGESSTSITAERELVEELFLPEAEYSKYVRADLGDIIHFGEWNPQKRPERLLKAGFGGLSPSDWVMFRATDDDGEPLVVTRVSERRIHDDEASSVVTKRTVFRSDVYLFVAPKGYLDTEEQMDRLVGLAEQSGAAQDHRLVSINALRAWIHAEESANTAKEVFTDDILYINLAHRALLEGFAEFVRYLA